MTNNNKTDVLKLIDELYPDTDLLSEEQVRQLMLEHARLPTVRSMRQAALEIGVSPVYWHGAQRGSQKVSHKIARGYHLERVEMYKVVRD